MKEREGVRKKGAHRDVFLPDNLDAPPNNLDHLVLDPLVLLERDLEPTRRHTLTQRRVHQLVRRVAQQHEEEERLERFRIRRRRRQARGRQGRERRETRLQAHVDGAGRDGDGDPFGGFRRRDRCFVRRVDQVLEARLHGSGYPRQTQLEVPFQGLGGY